MSNRRLARLNEQIRREVSDILRTEVRDPRVGLPTVTEVAVTEDLWLARIYVRPDPTREDAETDDLIEGLEAAAPFIRRALGKSLRVRRVPELRFEPDTVLERANRIEQLLREVLPPSESASDPDDGSGAKDTPGSEERSDSEEAPDSGEAPDSEDANR
ncbi:MAG: 30S ribosome-binding factor RbfA [Gemmatimonadota bacterium]